MFLTGLLVGVLLGIAVVMPVLSWCERERRRLATKLQHADLCVQAKDRELQGWQRQIDELTRRHRSNRTMWD